MFRMINLAKLLRGRILGSTYSRISQGHSSKSRQLVRTLQELEFNREVIKIRMLVVDLKCWMRLEVNLHRLNRFQAYNRLKPYQLQWHHNQMNQNLNHPKRRPHLKYHLHNRKMAISPCCNSWWDTTSNQPQEDQTQMRNKIPNQISHSILWTVIIKIVQKDRVKVMGIRLMWRVEMDQISKVKMVDLLGWVYKGQVTWDLSRVSKLVEVLDRIWAKSKSRNHKVSWIISNFLKVQINKDPIM